MKAFTFDDWMSLVAVVVGAFALLIIGASENWPLVALISWGALVSAGYIWRALRALQRE